jgi:hypothetical protein
MVMLFSKENQPVLGITHVLLAINVFKLGLVVDPI